VSAPGIGLLGLGAYLPERVMTNADWAEYVDTSDEWIRSRTGIERRRVAAEDESTADFAVAAARSALDDAGLTVQDIDEIIVATDTPEVYLPDTAAIVQARLGAREVTSFDIGSSGCAGFVLAVDVARSRARDGKRVLVIGVELLTKLMNWEDRNTCVLFGDAAGATVVGAGDDVVEILAADAGTDGTKNDILGLECGGTRVPFTVESAAQGLHLDIVMHGREVFKNAVARMTASSNKVLEQAGVGVEDLALVVPHQANLRILESVRERLGATPEQVYINVQNYGNTGSASVPLALWEARNLGRIAPGDLVLLTAFGAGFHWASMVVRF
jgi:3-oxoacyl-[acyl-carrier-protein] synthase-3